VRIGFGYDVHAYIEGRPLILGGVQIPHTHGLLGHSDADVLLHAICDGLLGAAAAGDLGRHFPDTSPAFKGVSSLILLQKTAALLTQSSFSVANIDTTLVLQQPKVAEYVPQMRKNISDVLQIPLGCVSVKATTTEKLGFAGREEGVAAYAVVLINDSNAYNGMEIS
jgi:2-C-methyl-D-erythritol 2,4-cyclodiphosphate synthase